MLRLRIVLTGSLLFCILLIGCNNEQKQTLDFGVVVPLSGNSANYGESARRGIDLAVKEINAVGGVSGKKLRPIYEDDKAIARDGVNATQKLINVDKVPVIIGGIVSAVTLAAAPICESNKVVWLSPTSSAPAITQSGEYIFRNFPSDNLEGKVMADFIHKRGLNKVAVLQVQNDYGEGIGGVFADQFKKLGGAIQALEKHKQDESDFRSVLSKVSQSSPDALYAIGYYTDVALITKQAREQGIKLPIFATTTIEDPQFIKLAGAAAEGVIYPLASGYDAASTATNVAQFKTNYTNEYKNPPGFVEAQAYDCVYLVKKAIELGGGITGPEIQRGMAQIKGFQGATGTVSFDENGDVVKEIVLKTVAGGKFVPVDSQASSQAVGQAAAAAKK